MNGKEVYINTPLIVDGEVIKQISGLISLASCFVLYFSIHILKNAKKYIIQTNPNTNCTDVI